MRAQAAEGTEVLRAMTAEANISSSVDKETVRAQAAEGAEAVRAMTAEATLTQNLLVMGKILANETARANKAENALRASLAADEIAISQMSTALVATQTKLGQTTDQFFQMQNVYADLQNNYSKLMKFAVCSGRGMFADMDGNCFSASSAREQLRVVFAHIRPTQRQLCRPVKLALLQCLTLSRSPVVVAIVQPSHILALV